MKKYPGEFADDGAHGHGFELLVRSGHASGLVIDLGCASGPLAEPVRSLGCEYIGADIDKAALADLSARGFEAHELDLQLDEDALVDALRALARGRKVAAVLLLDVIEHLVDPDPALRAIARLGTGEVPDLIVSIPNVAHIDVGAKLLAGRWDLTKIGLLDDTHVRFFTDQRVRAVMSSAGWTQVDAFDVVNPFSDQMFPADAPVVRPGTPLRELLCRVRMTSDAFGETYQYVRRFEHGLSSVAPVVPADSAEEPASRSAAPFLSIVTRLTGATDGTVLVRDLAAQTTDDFEVIVSGDPRAAPTGVPDLEGLGVQVVRIEDETDWRNAAIVTATGRYVAFVDDRTRLAPWYADTIRETADLLPARVVQAAAFQHASAGPSTFEDLAATATTVDIDPLDLVSARPFGSVVLAAHAVPREACATTGLRFASSSGSGSVALFLLRAVELCGIVRSDREVIAVEAGAVRDLAANLLYLQEELGRTPMVIPEGAASYALYLRQLLSSVLPERDRLAAQLEATNEQVGALTSLIRQRENEVAKAIAESEAVRVARERRLSAKLRRRVGRLARSI